MRKIITFLALAGVISALPLLAQQGNNKETGAEGTGKAEGKREEATSHNLEVLPTRHLAVQVKINGKGPLRLILDTGSPLTFLSNQAAQRAGLITGETAQPTLFGMRGQVTAKTLDVGGAQISDFSLLVLDHPVIEALSEIEGPIDGILGFTFFARYKTVIDYASKTVTFTPGTYHPDDLLTGLIGRLMKGEGSKRILSPAALWGMEVAHSDTLLGVVVIKVYPQSAAAQAGLRVDDRILLLDGRWTDTPGDCFEAVAQIPAGQETILQVKRKGKTLLIHVQPRSGL
jgi:hypothetical protein